tara:strand:- start:874 stop:1173 length:300 start_codon:yes stop_codon:yes gene_type:complete
MKDKRTYIKHKEHGEDISHENESTITNDDRGTLDLERRLEDKDKIIDKLRMNMRDYIMMHQTDKDLLGVKIKEVAELKLDNKRLAKEIDNILNMRNNAR